MANNVKGKKKIEMTENVQYFTELVFFSIIYQLPSLVRKSFSFKFLKNLSTLPV